MYSSSPFIYQITGNQYPFGQFDPSHPHSKTIFIKKRHPYKNPTQHAQIIEKIDKLKTISHKNTINLRSTDDRQDGYIDLFYPYISIPLEQSFNWNPQQTVKALHKQFIELAIYLAKNYILTSFNPSRCGVVLTQNGSQIKYYLPLNQISMSSNMNMLERSVQLFNLQSMHYLDTLAQNAMNNTIQNSSQCSFKNRSKLFPEPIKKRKDSQPTSLITKINRKYSTAHAISPQMRKLSNLSKELSQFSQMHKKRAIASTRISVSNSTVFNTLNSLGYETGLNLRRCVSDNKDIDEKIHKIKQRSLAALKSFRNYKENLMKQSNLLELLKLIKV